MSESDDDHSSCVTEGMVLGDITYNTINTVATFTPKCLLKESTFYTATITPPAGVQQSVLAETMSWSFTTIAMTPDSDGDGDPDAGDDSPNDCRNATPGIPKGKGKITMNLDGHPNGCFKKIKATSETDPSVIPTGMPSGYEFRDGIIAYEIVGISTGETDTVTLTYPEAFPAGSKVYKVDSGGFYEYPDAVIDGNTVTLKVTDGGKGDMDGTADGKILDPVGVAVPAASGGGTIDLSTDAAGGGCSVVGTGGGWKEAAGSYGLLALVLFGLALRRRKPESGR
ncbi:MAG TPA: Ig-like domain-containing protein [Candidatus Limnocylindria bacterium]|nr:Ig-like domain-containing protein [Candidatus Limnocylindria bacterium]